MDLTTFVDFLVGKLLGLIRFLVRDLDGFLDEGGSGVVREGNENGFGLGARVASLESGCLRLRFGSSSLSSSLT